MSYEALQLERRGEHVALVTLNRPDKLNALNGQLRDEILSVAAEVRDDDSVWAVVLTGSGRGFCSGADLTGGRGEAPPPRQADLLDEFGWVGRQAMAIYGLDKPTVAAVNGVAAGAGMSLALSCDMRVGNENARFRTVFIERNLSPDSGMSFFLPRIVGYSRAADLIFTSRDVKAEEAYRLGLLDRLVEGDVVEAAVELADTIASWPPVAMRSAKRVLQHNVEVGIEEALKYEHSGLSYGRRAANDARESALSFREKRKPNFTGT